jgi:toxin-antitoxin system PIN domain toxin
MKSFFPDVNVWVALVYQGHQHHSSALAWFDNLNGDVTYFCRLTQLGFLRLLTHPTVMRDEVRSQTEAWLAYDFLLGDERVSFQEETDPEQLESSLRRLTSIRRSSSKQWPDAYLAAFARTAGLALVTFDHGLHRMAANGALLLS